MSDRATWDQALASLQFPPPLLQSQGYAEIQRQEGWSPVKVELASARALVLMRGRGPLRWAYVPRGPVPSTPGALAELVSWARGQRLARLRVEPEPGQGLVKALEEAGFAPAPALHPGQSLIVPLADEESMLAAFRPKHRYNIRLSERRRVLVECGEDVEELRRQALATGQRQSISVPTLEAYRRRLEKLAWCRVYVARHEGRPLAAIMVARFAGRAYYLFGGGGEEGRQLMPSYALQWRAMTDAREAGCVDYDLWGVPPSPDPTHPWAGLWQFKVGFGGQMVVYPGAWELVLGAGPARLLELQGSVRRALKRGLGGRS